MLSMFLANFLPIIATAAGTLVTALLGVGIKYLSSKIKNEAVRNVTERSAEAVVVAIAAVEQTMRPKVVSALADGKLTDEEKNELREAALEAVRVQMGGSFSGIAETLGLSMDEARKFLIDRIEAALFASK